MKKCNTSSLKFYDTGPMTFEPLPLVQMLYDIIFRAIKLNRYLLKFISFQKLFSTTSLIKMLLVVWMSLVQVPFEPKSQNQVIFNKTFCRNVLSGNNKLGCLLVFSLFSQV